MNFPSAFHHHLALIMKEGLCWLAEKKNGREENAATGEAGAP